MDTTLPMAAITFPTELHKQAVETIKDFFLGQQNIDTILLVNSLARGKATPDSDIDLAVLVSPTTTSAEIKDLDSSWHDYSTSNPSLNQYRASGKFAQIHLDIFDGVFEPAVWENGVVLTFLKLKLETGCCIQYRWLAKAHILKG